MPSSLSAPFSLRLFPKDQGASAYKLTGIAAQCDWVILSDLSDPRVQLRKIRTTGAPERIFLSLRNPVVALRYFHSEVLPELTRPFVLISGSEDVTLPVQTDTRWPIFDARARGIIDAIAASPKVLHWFAENLDCRFSERISPLPTGMVYPDNLVPAALERPDVPSLASRPLRVFCAHRVRPGAQWYMRRKVTGLAESAWAGFTTNLTREVSESDFLHMVSEHSFALCVEGGGIDPSPKAWQVLQYGAIPIIRKSPLWEAYRDLPCVAVEDWNSDCLSPEKLTAWKAELLERFDGAGMRDALFEQLSIGYWWKKITAIKAPAPSPHVTPRLPVSARPGIRHEARRVVIICPGEVVSGGPEALHQLGAALCEARQDVAMCYFPFEKEFAEGPIQYHGYGVPVCRFEEIGDADVVLPEARTGFSRLFRPERTWIWWLSVDNYRGALKAGKSRGDPERHVPLLQLRKMNHLSQSAYATEFLRMNGFASMPLGDYLAEAHDRRVVVGGGAARKERIVLYNPKKGQKITQSLIEALPQEHFVPIADLDHAGVARLLERAALYIDFGPHPGKDRLPREAAMAGCCIVTGRQGAAGNAIDVAIPERYKINEKTRDFLQAASRAIVDILDHWPERQRDFDAYRQGIVNEKECFGAQARKIFATPRPELVVVTSDVPGSANRPQGKRDMEQSSHRDTVQAQIKVALDEGRYERTLEIIAANQAEAVGDIVFLRGALAKLRRAGRAAELLPVLTGLIRQYPGKIGLRMELGRTHLGLGNLEGAEQAFSDVIARDLQHVGAWLGQIDVALAHSDPAVANRQVDAALAALPLKPAIVEKSAGILMRSGRLDAARACLETALAGNGTREQAIDGTGDGGMTLLLSRVRREMGALEESDVLCRGMLKEKPDHAGAWMGRIQVALAQGDIDLALSLSATGCETCPDNPGLQRLRAEVLRQAGREGEAIAALEALCAQWPDNTAATIALGHACLRLGRLDDAERIFGEVFQQNPDSWPALQGRVNVAEARGDFDLALKLLENTGQKEMSDVLASA